MVLILTMLLLSTLWIVSLISLVLSISVYAVIYAGIKN